MHSFDDLTFEFGGADSSYLTHSIHPFPAKFPPQLPQKLLRDFAKIGQKVLDPFCGSGTTLVEARLLGIDSIGVDVNGLACLLSKVKSSPINDAQAHILDDFVALMQQTGFQWGLGNRRAIHVLGFDGLTHWFQSNVAEEISLILAAIDKLSDQTAKDFLRIVLSAIIVRVSNQDSDTRFAAVKKNVTDGYTLNLFVGKAKEYLERIKEYSRLASPNASVEIFNADSRDLDFIEDESIDLIVTSPPYANTYDYYLYHKFRKRWLGLDVHFAQHNEIGSRREFSSLKKNPEKWFDDLRLCFAEMSRVLKGGSLAFIVIGDSVIRKTLIKMDEQIRKLSPSVGFKVRHMLSSDLSHHSKIFNPAFAQKGKREHLIILEKKS